MKQDTLSRKISFDEALKTESISALALTGKPSFPLDWENITYMPAPSGVTPIPIPWSSGLGGAKIDGDVLYDYDTADGWALVYNTFNDSIVYNPSYFMQYNKYRGVLRTYFYFAPGQDYPSDNLVSEILLNGSSASTSPMLNFVGNDVVDYNTIQSAATQLQQYKVSSSGSWYASEFELAYDKNTSITNYPNTTLEWQINPNSIAGVTLNGTDAGGLNGTLQVPTSKTNFFWKCNQWRC